MKYQLESISSIKRIDRILVRYDPKNVIYIGDGIFDHYVMKKVGYSIALLKADQNEVK